MLADAIRLMLDFSWLVEDEKERKEQEGLAESQVEVETRIETEQMLRAELERQLAEGRHTMWLCPGQPV